jgi:hypothetical protein
VGVTHRRVLWQHCLALVASPEQPMMADSQSI